ncbi:MAG: hypothetical protein K2M94_02160, partial [Paramuribaculum sp.]|nr:hypothetical protein [Paramuribaculum sp.]
EETNLTPPEMPAQQPAAPQVVINNIEQPKNNMGVAGFVLALCGLVFCWVPVLNWILVLLGLVFSIIGVTRKPKGLAIAGICIAAVTIVILIIATIIVAAAINEVAKNPEFQQLLQQ